jgi:hypothetical protein
MVVASQLGMDNNSSLPLQSADVAASAFQSRRIISGHLLGERMVARFIQGGIGKNPQILVSRYEISPPPENTTLLSFPFILEFLKTGSSVYFVC